VAVLQRHRRGGAVASADDIFEYIPIRARPDVSLPGGARIAVWLGVNVEHYVYGFPALSLYPEVEGLVPDPINYGWRDYGNRVGIWRLMERLAAADIRATAIVNSEACRRYPQILDEALRIGWSVVAHGRDNSTLQAQLPAAEEEAYIHEVTAAIERNAGTRPRGWLGPFRSASAQTNEILARAGYTHSLDWGNDDQPYLLKTTEGRLCAVPYSIEVGDVAAFVRHGYTGHDFETIIVDAFETLYAEGARSPRVLGISLHPFLVGQSFRIRYLMNALDHISGFDRVWWTTSDEIADWARTEFWA
jgi:peptidoglycan/xylan/chitin deacetylase (PgdA/CDA1 family)